MKDQPSKTPPPVSLPLVRRRVSFLEEGQLAAEAKVELEKQRQSYKPLGRPKLAKPSVTKAQRLKDDRADERKHDNAERSLDHLEGKAISSGRKLGDLPSMEEILRCLKAPQNLSGTPPSFGGPAMTVTHIVPEAVLQACRVLLAEDIKINKLWNDICSAKAELAHFKRDLHHQVFGATLERLQIKEAKLKRTETILRRRWRLIDANMQTARSQLQVYFGDQSHSFEFVQTFGQAIAATKQSLAECQQIVDAELAKRGSAKLDVSEI